MVQKSYFLKKLISIFFITSLLCCKKEAVQENKIFIWQAQKTTEMPLVLNNGLGKVSLSISSAYVVAGNESVKIEILDSNFIKSYNEKNRTEYVAVPDTAINISAKSVSFAANAASASPLMVTVKEWKGYVEGRQYVVPVKIVPATMPVVSGSDIAFLLVSKVITSYAAMDANCSVKDQNFGKDHDAKPFTVEGQFNLKRFEVPGNWRSDIFVGMGMQFLVGAGGGYDVRFPNAAFMGTTQKATLNTWIHFAITYSGGVATLFINGEQVGQTNYPGLKISTCTIAGYTEGTGCAVKEFRVWKTVRTKKQLRTFMCAVSPTDTGLLAYWKFDEGTGNTIKDVSGNGFNLTSVRNIIWVPNVKCPQ